MLLLFLMSKLCPNRVRAIYVNHQLQQQSDGWAIQVQAYCEQLEIPCVIQAVEVATGNLENQARLARYQAFGQHLGENDVLVLGHHQQDQAETVLLRLMSGAGVSGLSAMRSVDQREDFKIWRPLLDLSREQICQWAAQSQLQHVEDPTNLDVDYDRAWCRLKLWPLVQQRFPQMQGAIARSSLLMQDANEILSEVLHEDLKRCGDSECLNVEVLLSLSVARRRQLLSYWMKGEGVYRPALQMVERIQNEVITSRSDAQAALHHAGYYYVRYQKKLYRLNKEVYLAPRLAHKIQNNISMQFQLNQCYKLAAGHFIAQPADFGLDPALLKQNLSLLGRQGGEKVHLYGRLGSWPLKKCIQEAHIFPWMRHTIQILSRDNVMLGVFTPAGFWLAQSEYCVAQGWLPIIQAEY